MNIIQRIAASLVTMLVLAFLAVIAYGRGEMPAVASYAIAFASAFAWIPRTKGDE